MPAPNVPESNSFAALADADEDVGSTAAGSRPGTATPEHEASDSEAGTSRGQPVRRPKKLNMPLIWIDLEMTGLDLEKDTIIEVAVIATDGDLACQIEGPSMAIHHSEEVLEAMNEWCIEHHGKSGLTQRVRDSAVTMQQAEQQVLDFIREHAPAEGSAQLAGNSVHVDRSFLAKFMPSVVQHLSYRIVDVSSVKELARRWFFNAYKKAPRKALAHTAMSDIRESIEELKYYRKAIFKDPKQVK